MSVTIRPKVRVRRIRSERATPEDRYCSSSTACMTASIVAVFGLPIPVSTRLTVAVETPERAATSRIVARWGREPPAAARGAASSEDPGSGETDSRRPATTPPPDLAALRSGDLVHHAGRDVIDCEPIGAVLDPSRMARPDGLGPRV